jgi:hypothetical protein
MVCDSNIRDQISFWDLVALGGFPFILHGLMGDALTTATHVNAEIHVKSA